MRTGEISADLAIEEAKKLGTTTEVSVDYLTAIGHASNELARGGNWRDAVRLSVIARAAAGAAAVKPGAAKQFAPLVDNLDGDWVETASIALWQVPDARIYAEATEVGQRVVATARIQKNKQLEGWVLHALGTLNLDPWFANRNSETYRNDHAQWMMRAESESWDGTPDVLDKPAPLPEPDEVLARAEGFYKRAIELRSGEARSRSLKALAQTLRWRTVLDDVDRSAEVDKTIAKAIELLDPDKQPALIAELFSWQTKRTSKGALELVDELLRESPDGYARRIGIENTLGLYLYLADGLSRVAPERALTLVQLVSHLFAKHGDERRRANWSTVQMIVLVAALAPAEDSAPEAEDRETGTGEKATPVYDALNQSIERGKAEEWTESQLAGEMIRLSRLTTTSDEEILGIKLLDLAESIAPLTLAPFKNAIAYYRSALFVNCGANAYHENVASTVKYYAAALEICFDVGDLDAARQVMDRLIDVADAADAEAAAAVLAVMIKHATALVTKLEDAGTEGVKNVCDRAIIGLANDRFDAAVLTGLWQIAKGLQFGTFLNSGATLRFTPPEDSEEVLGQIASMRDEVRAEPPAPGVLEMALATETVLLSPYSRSSMRLPGRTARERLNNLELEYESMLDRRLRALAGEDRAALISPAELQEALDPSTVLLDLLQVTAKDGTSHLLYSIWSREAASFARQPLGRSNGRVVVDGVVIDHSMLADIVGSARQNIQKEPGTGETVHQDSVEYLARCGNVLLGPVWEELKKQRAAGKTRLCIVPNGPLHYLPFHLLTIDDKPLVDHWNVSYLPNTRLLLASRGPRGVRKARVAGPVAFGMSFRGSRAPIPEAVKEVQAIISAAQGRPILEAQVTEPAVLEAMQRSRAVHIASHGEFQSGAAAFQRIFVTPDDEHDGMLNAHELLGIDGRGLNLVTLSACETALGRFDVGDNLRGLSANLFLAGVETVIGTLWEVETKTTTTFFVAFYKALAADPSRIKAFTIAQRATRSAHPEYRDWGAFYYAGTW